MKTRITSSRTKFTNYVAALPQVVAFWLLDLVRAPPVKPYKALRRRLIQMYSLSNFQRYQSLKSLALLTDQCPSELMDKMLVLFPAWFFLQRPVHGPPPRWYSSSLALWIHQWPLRNGSMCWQTLDNLWTQPPCPCFIWSVWVRECFPRCNSSSRSGARSAFPRSSSRSSV